MNELKMLNLYKKLTEWKKNASDLKNARTKDLIQTHMYKIELRNEYKRAITRLVYITLLCRPISGLLAGISKYEHSLLLLLLLEMRHKVQAMLFNFKYLI